MNRDQGVLLDMRLAIEDIVRFAEGIDSESFQNDAKTQAAVQFKLLVLGESVRRLSEPFKSSHTAIPWRQIAGLRNRIAHEYERVDMDEVWRVVTQDIPNLERFIDGVLSASGEP